MEEKFEEAFAKLNPEQKRAVEMTTGPLFVMAGPGTGKTELLALRAAQILRTDTTMLPGNILCLTFTDNAADNMRRRLTRYIGQDAYSVAIHTFNSFGQYVMNAHPEYFYEWREMQTADELTTHRILEEILTTLPGSHVLAGRGMDGTFYSIKQLKNLIGDAKKNNLTPDELIRVISQNEKAYSEIIPVVNQYWPASMTAKDALGNIDKFMDAASKLKPAHTVIDGVMPEKNMILESLTIAAAESSQLEKGKTKPFTAWKDQWLQKDESNGWTFRATSHIEKLKSAAQIYEEYQSALDARGLADFNDQIMWVLRTMREKDELRYNLQERFQYVMIDEFQDTNRAQLLLAQYITDAPVHEGRPNIMVVGDDDQAIFRFQGADLGNVGDFEKRYDRPESVALIKNYRSTQEILTASRGISRQITLSLENQKQITKELVASVESAGGGIRLNQFENESQHYAWVAQEIQKLLGKGVKGKEIAVLARQRSQLDSLVPYLRSLSIAIDYERSENVLEQEHVAALLKMARLVAYLGEQRLDEANELLAPTLSEPMWGIETADIWQVARSAYRQKRLWLDVIFEQKDTRLRQIADFLVELGGSSKTLPAEQILDRLVGAGTPGKGRFVSPFKEYYFGEELLKNQPADYLTLLSHLSTLRRHLRKYQSNQTGTLTIKDMVDFADSYMRTETLHMVDTSPHRENDEAVNLMTVHKAKGLEFDNVFVIALQNNSWTTTGRSNRFSYPNNLRVIKPADNDDDDSLRLLFVAMTRARHSLQLSYYLSNEDGKAEQPFGALLGSGLEPVKPAVKESSEALTKQYEQRWLTRHAGVDSTDMRAYFSEKLEGYKLSATHLNDFLDVSIGGPLYFLTQHLLFFPSMKPPPASYGSAVHAAMSEAHEQRIHGGVLKIDKVVDKFQDVLKVQPLSKRDFEYYSQEGMDVLRFYLQKEAAGFNQNQKVDFSFSDQAVMLGKARLKGTIDRMDLDDGSKTVVISDYKTGSPESKWQLPPSAKEYERIKMHRYRNQLMFYKLLLDGADDWGKKGWRAESGVLRFLKANQYGKLNSVVLNYEQSEMSDFERLVSAVWKHIQNLNFPGATDYPPTLEGILEFEKSLIDGAKDVSI